MSETQTEDERLWKRGSLMLVANAEGEFKLTRAGTLQKVDFGLNEAKELYNILMEWVHRIESDAIRALASKTRG